MGAAVDLDMSVLEHLDFPPRCEVRFSAETSPGKSLPLEERCERTAEWAVTCRGCGVLQLCCDDHLKRIMSEPRMQCSKCRRTGVGHDVYVFAPLEG